MGYPRFNTIKDLLRTLVLYPKLKPIGKEIKHCKKYYIYQIQFEEVFKPVDNNIYCEIYSNFFFEFDGKPESFYQIYKKESGLYIPIGYATTDWDDIQKQFEDVIK